MQEFLTTIQGTPIPTLLVIGGLVFLFLGIATIKKPIVIDVTPSSRKTALILGILLVSAGLYFLAKPLPGEISEASVTPTTTSEMLSEAVVVVNPSDTPAPVVNPPDTPTPIEVVETSTSTPSVTTTVGFVNNCINSDLWVPVKKETNDNGCWQLPKSGIAAQDGQLLLLSSQNQAIDWYGIYTSIAQNVDINFTIKVDKLYSPNNDAARIAFGIVDPGNPLTGNFLYYREYTNRAGLLEFGKGMFDANRVGTFDPNSGSQNVAISIRGIILNIYVDSELIAGPVNLPTSNRAFGIFYRPVKDSDVLAYISNLQIEEK